MAAQTADESLVELTYALLRKTTGAQHTFVAA